MLYAGGLEEDCLEGMVRIRELYPGVPLLVLGSHLDLALAWATLKNGADGFVHAQMHPAQVLSAVEVVQKGELAAPRQLLRWYLCQNENPEIGDITARGRRAGTAHGGLEQRSDSRAPVRVGVYDQAAPARRLQGAGGANRTEAAKTMRDHAQGV